MTDQNYDEAVAVFVNSQEFDEAALAWAREHMKCETCKWWQDGVCEDRHALCHGQAMAGDDSCATYWEPKP